MNDQKPIPPEAGKKYILRNGDHYECLRTDLKNDDYPVVGIVTDSNGSQESEAHDLQGYYDKTVTTFSSFDIIREATPWEDFEDNDPVMVRDNDVADWLPSYFSHEEDGKAHTYAYGATKWTGSNKTVGWNQCRRPTEEELK